MARKHTPHMLVNEGITGRIIARRALRRSLGNPKKRSRDLAELMSEMFSKGIKQGRQLENLRIIYATAGMDYPTEDNAGPVGDVPVLPAVVADIGPVIPEPPHFPEGYVYNYIPQLIDGGWDYPDADAIPR